MIVKNAEIHLNMNDIYRLLEKYVLDLTYLGVYSLLFVEQIIPERLLEVLHQF